VTGLGWSGCPNARDLGGLPTRYGGTTRPRALIRTDSLHKLDEAGRAAFAAYGAGLILDLRSDGELVEPHPSDGAPTYQRIPWIDQVRDRERDPSAELVLADIYRGSLDRNTAQVAKAVRAVIEAPDGPVVVHCHSGKDRTGMLVGLLLDLVGVPRDLIAADYALSEERLGTVAALAGREWSDEAEQAAAMLLAHTSPETMLAMLDHVDARYGGARAYLQHCGLTSPELDRLTRRLTIT
jgi:protein tyrosine/serine phosphatase